MEPYLITCRDEYDFAKSRGFEPLLDRKNFALEIHLRVAIQKELFWHNATTGGVSRANEIFYRWVWANKRHQCEETMIPLENYAACFVSHILTRGAHPEMAHDPRNTNILCFSAHEKWENGKRSEMRIYPANLKIMELLVTDYNGLKNE